MQLTTRVWVAAWGGAVVAGALSGCGGGGDSAPSGGPTVVVQGAGPGNPAGCPRGELNDIWLNRRLGCLVAGQQFIRQAAGATGETADRAFIVNQSVLDLSFKNVLGTDEARYFKYALCVRNAPSGVGGQALAMDMTTVMGLSSVVSGRQFYPATVSGSTMGFGGSADVHVVATPCDPMRHPVIVNYANGQVESVNPLATLATYDR